MLDINVMGTFFSYKYAAIQMIKQGRGGRIVGAASVASKRGTFSSLNLHVFVLLGSRRSLWKRCTPARTIRRHEVRCARAYAKRGDGLREVWDQRERLRARSD